MTSKVWSEIQPNGSGDFVFEPGHRYAVLASVSLDYSLDRITAKAQSEGFQVTYAWQTGQASRATYQIDNWLDGLPADTTSNHRWVYAEGNFEGSSAWSLGVDAPWPFSIYHVAHVFEAVDAPDQPSAEPAQPSLPTSTSSSSSSSSTGWARPLFEVGMFLLAASLGYYAGAKRVPFWPRA